jgi:hypothetical protein
MNRPLCACGCGVEVSIADRNFRRDGIKKGDPFRFVANHHQKMMPKPDIAERFWTCVQKTDTCWLWTGATVSGYGVVSVSGKVKKAHRVAYELTYGPIDSSFHLMHSCDVRRCVREHPDHVHPGTKLENMHDAAQKDRTCHGEQMHNAKLTESDVRLIRKIYAAGGVTKSALAQQFHIHNVGIGKIIRRELWRRVID